MFNLLPLGLFGISYLFGLLIFVLDIVAIVSVLMGRGSIGHKLLWVLLIILLPVVGMVLYFIFGKSSVDL